MAVRFEIDGYIIDVAFVDEPGSQAFEFEIVTCIKNPQHRYSAEYAFAFFTCNDEKSAITELFDFITYAKPFVTEKSDEIIINIPDTAVAASMEIHLSCSFARQMRALQQEIDEMRALHEWNSGVEQELEEAREEIEILRAVRPEKKIDLKQEEILDLLRNPTVPQSDQELITERAARRAAEKNVAELISELFEVKANHAKELKGMQEKINGVRARDLKDMKEKIGSAYERDLREMKEKIDGAHNVQLYQMQKENSGGLLLAGMCSMGSHVVVVSPAVGNYRAVNLYNVTPLGFSWMRKYSIQSSLVDGIFQWQSHGAANGVNMIVDMVDIRARVIKGEIHGLHKVPQYSSLFLVFGEGNPVKFKHARYVKDDVAVPIIRKTAATQYNLFHAAD